MVVVSNIHGATPVKIFHVSIDADKILSNQLITILFVLIGFQTLDKGVKIIDTKGMESLFNALQFP